MLRRLFARILGRCAHCGGPALPCYACAQRARRLTGGR
jgi:hypothetical protein